MVVSVGLTAGITYEVSQRRWSVRRAFRISCAAALSLGLIGFAVGLTVFVALQGDVFRGIGIGVAFVALASVPPILAYQFSDSIMLARERYEGYAALEISHSTVLLIVGAGLALPFGLEGAVVGLFAAACVGAAMGAHLVLREAAGDTVPDAASPLGPAVRFGLQSWGANLLQQINYRFDIIILGGFAAAREVGLYSVALTLTGVAWVLPQALQTVLFPRVASLHAATVAGELTPEESDAALAKAVRHGVLLTVPAAALIAALLLVAVPLLYGPTFSTTTALGFVLLPGTLLLGIAKVLASAITGRGRPRYALYAGLITVPVTLALYFALIPPYAAWGAAVASSASYAFSAFVGLFFFRRVANLGLREAFVPRAEDISDYAGLLGLVRAWRGSR